MTASSRFVATALGLTFSALIAFHVPSAEAAPIKIEVLVQDGPGEGFNDPVLGPQRLFAFQFAASLWGSFFVSSFPGQTVRVGINVGPLADFAALGDPLNLRIDLPPPVAFGLPILNQLLGADSFPNMVDGEITFNEQTDFFLGTGGNPGNRLDFVTLALHELGHLFGFSSTLLADGTYADGFPTVYDYGVQDRLGNQLTDLSPQTRLEAATSGDGLFWAGTNGIAANGGIRPNLSAGTQFVKGSNVLHLSNTFGPGNLLMDAVTEEGTVIRRLSALERGIFEDLGWNLASAQATPEPCTLLLVSIGLLSLLGCASRRAHSMRMFAALMTFAHFSRSRRMNSLNSAGLLLETVSRPAFRYWAFTDGWARMRTVSACSLRTTAAGVPAGARSPNQPTTS